MKIKNVNISKLNFSLLVSTGILVFLTIFLLILLAGRRAGRVQGNIEEDTGGFETTENEEKTTVSQDSTGETGTTYGNNDFTEEPTEPVSTLTFDVDADGDIASRPTYINANISSVTYWDYGDTVCTQFRVVISNVSKSVINNWGIVIEFDKNIELLDYWNANMESEGEDIKITPVSVNQKIGTADEFVLGFIISCARSATPKSYKVIVGNNIQQINLNRGGNTVNPPATTTSGQITTRPQQTTTTAKNTTSYVRPTSPTTTTEENTTGGNGNGNTTAGEEKTTEEKTTEHREPGGEDTTTPGEDMPD